MRLEMNEARQEKARIGELVDHYLKTHSRLARDMVEDYKRDAINNVIIELYANEKDKYSDKHRDLIERAKYGDTPWRQLKVDLDEKMAKRMKNVKDQQLPESLKRNIDKIYSHYKKFMDVQDADIAMVEVMNRVFDDCVDDEEDEESSEQDEEAPKSPGK